MRLTRMTARPAARLYVLDDLAAGLSLALAPPQAHYLRSVLRLAGGSEIALFNGRDGEWLGRVGGIGKGWGSSALGEHTRRQPAQRHLCVGLPPVKPGPMALL